MRRNRRGIAKAAASAAFAVALALGIMAPGTALADVGTGTGTVTITAATGNAGMVYDVYKIFTCDVGSSNTTANTYVATNISFPSAEMQNAVIGAITTYDKNFTGTTAQAAAGYLESHITGGSDYRAEANGLVMNLAKAIDDLGATSTLTAGTATDLTEGYYMIVARPAGQTGSTLSSSSSKVGTSPIFTMLGEGQNLSITEKTSVPTLTKTVAEGAAATSAVAYADAQVGQDVTFTLAGTVPSNIVSFTSYAYGFEDTLPAGMQLTCAGSSFAESDITVNVVNGSTTTQIATSSYAATYDSSTKKLTVSFIADGNTASNDLLVAKDTSENKVTIDANSKVTVSYGAKLAASPTVGGAGNVNTAKLIYSNDPQLPTTAGTSTAATAAVYTYQLDLYKYGVDQNTKLSGAKFTIQATTPDDTASSGKYVQENGTLGDTAYEFTTDGNGLISVAGLDAGTYTISETAAPDGYRTLTAPLTLVITPKFSNGAFSEMTASVSGGNGDNARGVVSTDNGIVTIFATDSLTEGKLPLTGLPGITLVYVLGGMVLVVSLTVIVRRRIKNQK